MTTQIAPNPANLLLGKGIVYLDRLDPSTFARTGEIDLGNCQSFAMAPKADVIKQASSRDHTAGTYATDVKAVEMQLKIKGSEFTKEILAFALGGDTSKLTQTGATVTGEALTASVKLGRWFATAKRGISSVVVKQGVTTLVAGTDYTIDATVGRIYFLPTGAATPDTAATVDYAYATISLDTIRPLVTPNIQCYARFVGDPKAGPVIEAEVWRVNFSPNGELGFITDDYGNWELTGDVVGDFLNHASEPYARKIIR